MKATLLHHLGCFLVALVCAVPLKAHAADTKASQARCLATCAKHYHFPSAHFQVPFSTTATEKPTHHTIVSVGQKALLVNRKLTLHLEKGRISAAYKKDRQANSYMVLPLFERLKEAAKRYKKIAKFSKKSSKKFRFLGRLHLVLDARLPYRTLTEVMYTAGQSGFDKFTLLVCAKGPKQSTCGPRVLRLTVPKLHTGPGPAPPGSIKTMAIIGTKGSKKTVGDILGNSTYGGDLDAALRGTSGVATASSSKKKPTARRKPRYAVRVGAPVLLEGKLSQPALLRVLRRKRRSLQWCGTKARRSGQEGETQLNLWVATSGRSARIDVVKSSAKAFARCLKRKLRRYRYPKPVDQAAKLRLTFHLTRQGTKAKKNKAKKPKAAPAKTRKGCGLPKRRPANIAQPKQTPATRLMVPVKAHRVARARLLNLTVSITQKGFSILLYGERVSARCTFRKKPNAATTFPRRKGKLDFPALVRCLKRIKKKFPSSDDKRLILMAEPQIRYQSIVQTIDAARQRDKGKIMFPYIVFSAGIL